MTLSSNRNKIDLARLSLFSLPKRTASASGAPVSRGSSADPKKPSGAVAGAVKTTNNISAFSREASRTSTSITKRSMSSEDARRLIREKMQREPDIEPKRGGNANMDKITPEYVHEFWMKKKLESDEFRRKRLLERQQQEISAVATPASGMAGRSVSPVNRSSDGASKFVAATTVAPSRQPLRVSRPLQRPAAAQQPTISSTPQSSPQPVLSKPTVVVGSKKPAASTAAAPAAANGTRTNSANAANRVSGVTPAKKATVASTPSPGQPVARKLLVGSALASKPVAAAAAQSSSPTPVATTVTSPAKPFTRSASAPSKPQVAHQSSAKAPPAAAKAPVKSAEVPKPVVERIPSALAAKASPSKRSASNPNKKRVHIDPSIAPDPFDTPRAPETAASATLAAVTLESAAIPNVSSTGPSSEVATPTTESAPAAGANTLQMQPESGTPTAGPARVDTIAQNAQHPSPTDVPLAQSPRKKLSVMMQDFAAMREALEVKDDEQLAS